VADTIKHPKKRDGMKIDIKESWDINYCCEELNLRADELKAIVVKVGPAVQDVRLHLAKKQLIDWPANY
jgi:hypothetical protein